MARPTWFTFSTREQHLGPGVNDAWWLTHKSLGRENTDVSPYLMANEWIAGQIGTMLRLPVPPCALMKKSRVTKGMFASLKFTRGDTTPDDADPRKCLEYDLDLCTGILLFDILVANADRHEGNLAVDNPQKPKRIHVYDHDRAMFGVMPGEGNDRLETLWERLGCTGGSKTGENRHCLLNAIESDEFFHKWLNCIERIPDFFVESVCKEAKDCGIKKKEVDMAILFLQHRKRHLHDIITKNPKSFPKIKWSLLQ